MDRRNLSTRRAVCQYMALRISLSFLVLLLSAAASQQVRAQCPQFLGTEAIADLPETVATPHWFRCISSVTADPAPFTFELTAQPATHNGVQIDWGDGSSPEVIGSWDGTTPIPHTYTPSIWSTYSIVVTTAACPSGSTGILVNEPETPGAGLVYGDMNAGCSPFVGLPKIDVNLAFSSTWSFSLDWGDGTAEDVFSMEDVFNDPAFDTLRFTSSTGDEIFRILGAEHTYNADNCSTGNCDHTLTLTYSNFCSVRGATTPFVPGGTIVGTGYKQSLLGNAFLTWDVDQAEIVVADPVVCWPENETSVTNAACPNCCDASSGNNMAGNGTTRTEKWDFGGASYIGTGPDPTNWIDWAGDCSSAQSHLLAFPAPGAYTVTLFTANHCGIDTTTQDILVSSPPSVSATGDETTLCPGSPFQFETASWSADFPLTAEDLSFNFTYGDGPLSITVAMVGGLIPFNNIPSQPGNIYDAAGNYDAAIQVFPTLAPTCIGAAIVPVTVLTPPVANFELPNDTCASQVSVTPIDASVNGLEYTWTLDGVGLIASDPNPAPVNLTGPGAFNFTLDLISANGCADSRSETITLADIPIADFSVSDACLGIPTVLDGSNSFTDAALGGPIVDYAWTLEDGSTLSGAIQNLQYDAPGTPEIELMVTTASGCSNVSVQSFDILPRPGIKVLDNDTVGCSPMVLALTAIDTTGITSSSNWIWDYGHGSNDSPDADGTHTWPSNNSEDTVFYSVSVEAGLGGCTSSALLEVAVAPAPFVQTDGGEICSGLSFPFAGNAFNLGETTEWFWEIDEVWSTVAQDYGTITSDFEDFNYTFTNPDNLTDTVSIELTVFRPNGCTAHDQATLLVRPAFAPLVASDSGCTPLAVMAPAQVALSVNWDFGDAANPDPPGAVGHVYTTPGDYVVSADGISVFGCAGSNAATVTVHPTPTPSISAEDALCAPEPVQPIRSTGGEDGATSWSLQVDLSTTYPWNGSTDTLISLPPGNHLLTVLATSSEGCQAEASTEVLVQDEVTADFVLPENGCAPIPFDVTNIDAPTGTLSTWVIETPFGTDTLNTPTPAAPDWIVPISGNDTTYTVSLTVLDPLTGCNATHIDSVTVLAQPVGQMMVDGLNGCDVTATFSYTGTADNLTWSFGDPFAPETESTSITTVSHAYPNPLGTGYTAVATVTATIGSCIDTDQVSFEIPAIVEAEVNLPDTLCMGSILSLENLSTGIPLAAGIAAGSWTWTVGQDTLIGFEPTVAALDSNSTSASAQTNSILPVTLTLVHPESGCSDATSADIVVLGNPIASFIATPDVLIDMPYTSNVIDLNQVANGGTVTWDVSENGVFDSALGIVTWPDGTYGIQSITVLVNNFGCNDSYSQEVLLIPPPPTVQFQGDTVSCAPLSATFFPEAIGVIDSLVWTFGQGGVRVIVDLLNNPIGFNYYEPGTYQVGVTAYGPGGTAVAEPQTVEVLNQVNAGFTMFPAECVQVGEIVEFTPNFNYPDAVYVWSFGDGAEQSIPEGSIVTHTYGNAGVPAISLTIQNALCTDSTIRNGCIIEFQGGSVGVPSAFTPTFGGDGSGSQSYGDDNLRDNNVFFPQLQGTPIAFSFTIYNRWGEQIFSTSEPGVGWNGYFQGKLCKQDVYVWRVAAVFLDGSAVEQAGDVTLIRR
jgi:hypothetical protein